MSQKSQLALSAEEGGVNKGIACLFFSRAGGGAERELPVCSMENEMDAKRTTCLLDSAAEGSQDESRPCAAASM